MSGAFFRVSGIDPNDGARIVFVWCRDIKSPHTYLLLGSGHVVGGEGLFLPSGVSVGQFSVVFSLPYGCSPGDVVVTDDKNGDEHLLDVTVTPCSTPMGYRPGAAVPAGDLAELTGKTNASIRVIDRSQAMIARNPGATS